MTRPYRILSFDGGGIRGAYTAMLLSMIEEKTPFLDKVDLFVGTSSGSILALCLAYGFKPSQIVELFVHFGKASFIPSDQGAKYQNTGLKELLKAHVFKDNPSLSQLRKKVVIPAFSLYQEEKKRWGIEIFHNFKETDISLVDALLASSAAPIYFPPYQNYVDGGVYAANPSMIGLSCALEHDPACTLSNAVLFSLGSLDMPHSLKEGVSNWHSSETHPPYALFTLVTEGLNEVPDYMCRQILKKNYFRLNTEADHPITIDDHEKILPLFEIAKNVPKDSSDLWKNALEWVEKNF